MSPPQIIVGGSITLESNGSVQAGVLNTTSLVTQSISSASDLSVSGNVSSQNITGLQQKVAPHNAIGDNHANSMQTFLTTLLGTNSNTSALGGFKGMYASYGNGFSGEEYYSNVGAAASDGRTYSKESLVSPASQCKSWFQAAVGKALEEGYFSTDEFISKYVPWFTGNVSYYVQIFSSNTQAVNHGHALSNAIATESLPAGMGAYAVGGVNWFSDGGVVTTFGDIRQGDPSTYVYCLGQANIANWPISMLTNFNWPALYGFLVFALNGYATGWSDTYYNNCGNYISNDAATRFATQGFQTMGPAGALTFYKWRNYYFTNASGAVANRSTNPDFFFEMHYGPNADFTYADIEQTVKSYMNIARDTGAPGYAGGNTTGSFIPLLWNPGQKQIDNFNGSGYVLPQIYGTSDEMFGIVMGYIMNASNNLRGAAYSGGMIQYFKDKIMTPLGITSVNDYVLTGEGPDPAADANILTPANPNYCEMSMRRFGLIASSNAASYPSGPGYYIGSDLVNLKDLNGSYLGRSWGCSSNIASNVSVVGTATGRCLWKTEDSNIYADDQLLHAMDGFVTKTKPSNTTTRTIAGGAPFGLIKIKHLHKLAVTLMNNGIYNGVEVLKPTTVDWLLNNHSSALSPLYFAPQYILAQAEALNSSFNGGFMRYADNIGNKTLYDATTSLYFWGGVFGTTYAFDVKSGDYITLGSHIYAGGAYPNTLPLSTNASNTTNFIPSSKNFRRVEGPLKALQLTKH